MKAILIGSNRLIFNKYSEKKLENCLLHGTHTVTNHFLSGVIAHLEAAVTAMAEMTHVKKSLARWSSNLLCNFMLGKNVGILR